MKQSRDVDSIRRWCDRPEGGASDEDRAAALTREALVSGMFSVGLDDERLAAVRESLETARPARPPFWLRPAIVAAVVSVSVATVMGYEQSWFAPLRERLRFRAIPPAMPEPVGPTRRHLTRPAATPPDDESLAHAELPAPEAPAAVSAPLPAMAPVPRPAPAPRRASDPPGRKLALADSPPPAPPAIPHREPAAPSEEVKALARAMSLLRGKHDAPAALAALDDDLARFPGGALAPEARAARVDALLLLGRENEALRALESLPLDAHRRATELQLIRGELRARTDCARAEVDFTAVLARVQVAALEERALYGRAACRSALGRTGAAADDLRRYLGRFPDGAHAGWARRWLENNR